MWGAIPGNIQKLLLAVLSGIIPVGTWVPYGMPEIDFSKVIALSTVLLLQPLNAFLHYSLVRVCIFLLHKIVDILV